LEHDDSKNQDEMMLIPTKWNEKGWKYVKKSEVKDP